MTTFKKPDGSLTSNLNETVKALSHYLILKDDHTDDTNYHKGIRAQSKEPILTADDRDCTPTEVKNAIYDLKRNKAQGKQQKYTREYIHISRL